MYNTRMLLPSSPHARAAFTMVELAIGLVIVGLLVGGMLAGSEMIHQGKIKKTVTQLTEIQQATINFRDQYNGYPGDLRNAADVLPTVGGIAPVSGNGNRAIENAGGSTNPDAAGFTAANERGQFFIQLGLAGLTQQYDGSPTPGRGFPAPPLNPGTGMFVSGPWANLASSSNVQNMWSYTRDSIYLFVGVCNPSRVNTSSFFNDCAIFTPEEAWQIDTKLDDGRPVSGKIIAESYNTICAQGTNIGTAPNPVDPPNAYDLTATARGCNLLYSME